MAEIRTTVARLLHSGGPSRSRETCIVSIKSVNKPQRRAEPVTIDPNKARDKEVIADFQQALQPPD